VVLDGDGDVNLDALALTGGRAFATVDDRRRGMLSFQRLEGYQRAIEFIVLAIDIVNALPKGHAERADQLVRAAESVARNIAEGGAAGRRPTVRSTT
jgi:hypothetical protein